MGSYYDESPQNNPDDYNVVPYAFEEVNNLYRPQYNTEELRSVHDALEKARKCIKTAFTILFIAATVNIFMGALQILFPSALSDMSVFDGISAIDYIIFGLIYLALSIGIYKNRRLCVVLAIMVLAVDVAVDVFYGIQVIGFFIKAAILIGVMQGAIGCFKFHRLEKKHRYPSGGELNQMIVSIKFRLKALHMLPIFAVALIGIWVGGCAASEMFKNGYDLDKWSNSSSFFTSTFFPVNHPRVESLDYLYEPLQTWTTGNVTVQVSGIDVNIEFVAEYSIAGRVVGARNYTGRKVADLLSPRDVALAWGWLSDKEVDSEITWGPWSDRGFRYSANRWGNRFGGVGEIRNYMSNNHLIPDSDKTRKLLYDIRVGHYVKIEGYLVNVTYYTPNGSYFYWNTDTARDNDDCEIIYVTNVTWLQEP